MDEAGRSLDEIFGKLVTGEKKRDAGRRLPFKFLDPYDAEDREIFFGREAEQREIFRKFFSERLLLVYGESGTGKTSLLRCGLLAQVPPSDLHIVHLRNSADPWSGLARALDLENGLPAGGFLPALRQLSRRTRKPIALVFDQLEEVFILEDETTRRELCAEVASWLDSDLDLRVVLVVREEYLGRLSELEVCLPSLFDNRVWIRRMDPEQAREALVGPCRVCGVEVEEGLPERLLGHLAGSRREIELPDLQVLMDRLYRRSAARDEDHPEITVADYEDCGRLENILAEFLVDSIAAMPDPEASKTLLKAMVTADGTKRAVSVEEAAAALEESTEAETEALLRSFEAARIARDRGDGRFELRHDALARTVHSWLTESEKELIELRQMLDGRLREYQRDGSLLDEGSLRRITPHRERLVLGHEARRLVEASETALRAKRSRRRRLITAAAALAFLILAGFSAWNLVERRKADTARRQVEAESRRANFNLARNLLERARTSAELGKWREVLLFSAGSVLHQAKAGQTLPIDVVQPGPFQRWRFDNLMVLESQITAADYDPDSARVVFATTDGSIHVRALRGSAIQSKDQLSQLRTGTDSVYELDAFENLGVDDGETVFDVALDPKGLYLAACVRGEHDGLRLWEIQSGTQVGEARLPDCHQLVFDSSGSFVVVASYADTGGLISLWGTDPFRERWAISSPSRISSLAVNPVGGRFAWGTWDGRLCAAVSAEKSAMPRCIQAHDSAAISLAFSPDGEQMVSAGSTYEIVSREDVNPFGVSMRAVVDENRDIFAAFRLDGFVPELKLWTESSLRLKAVVEPHRAFRDLSFDLSGRLLVGYSGDLFDRSNEVGFWKADDLSYLTSVLTVQDEIRLARFLEHSDDVVAVGARGAISSGTWIPGNPSIRIKAPGSIRSLAFDDYSGWLVSGHDNTDGERGAGLAYRWDTESGTGTGWSAHKAERGIAMVTPNSKGAVILKSEGVAFASLEKTGITKDIEAAGCETLTTVAISPKSDLLAIQGCLDPEVATQDPVIFVEVWEIDGGALVGRLDGLKSYVRDMAFNEDGSRLVLGGGAHQQPTIDGYELRKDKRLLVWEPVSDRIVAEVTIDQPVDTLGVSNDGQLVAVAHLFESPLRLYDLETLELHDVLSYDGDLRQWVRFSPDGRDLAVVDGDSVHLWDLETMKRRATLSLDIGLAHSGQILAMAFSPDGKRLATGDVAGNIAVWDLSYLWLGLPFPYSEDDAAELVAKIENETSLSLAGEGDRMYRALDSYLILREIGKRDTAKLRIQEVIAGLTVDDWIIPVARYFAGEIDEAAVFEAARSEDPKTESERMCEAHYYVGMMRLLDGDTEAARQHFEASVATGVEDFLEHAQSRRRLEEMVDQERE